MKPSDRSIDRALREYVRSCLGADRVRVARNRDVHAYGLMPRSGREGWYLVGTVESLRARALAFQARGNTKHRRRGRPLLEVPGQRHNVYLHPATVRFLRGIGDGSLSRGICVVAALFTQGSSS